MKADHSKNTSLAHDPIADRLGLKIVEIPLRQHDCHSSARLQEPQASLDKQSVASHLVRPSMLGEDAVAETQLQVSLENPVKRVNEEASWPASWVENPFLWRWVQHLHAHFNDRSRGKILPLVPFLFRVNHVLKGGVDHIQVGIR